MGQVQLRLPDQIAAANQKLSASVAWKHIEPILKNVL